MNTDLQKQLEELHAITHSNVTVAKSAGDAEATRMYRAQELLIKVIAGLAAQVAELQAALRPEELAKAGREVADTSLAAARAASSAARENTEQIIALMKDEITESAIVKSITKAVMKEVVGAASQAIDAQNSACLEQIRANEQVMASLKKTQQVVIELSKQVMDLSRELERIKEEFGTVQKRKWL